MGGGVSRLGENRSLAHVLRTDVVKPISTLEDLNTVISMLEPTKFDELTANDEMFDANMSYDHRSSLRTVPTAFVPGATARQRHHPRQILVLQGINVERGCSERPHHRAITAVAHLHVVIMTRRLYMPLPPAAARVTS